jgi:hypothetical protein
MITWWLARVDPKWRLGSYFRLFYSQLFRAPIIQVRFGITSESFPHGNKGGLRTVDCFFLSAAISSAKKRFALTIMSHIRSTDAPSSNVELIINNALKSYEKRTKNNLLAHPLAAQLQTCSSPDAILAILQEQVQGLDQSRSGDGRWTKWLDPTVNVLFAFSTTLGAGVGPVCSRICVYMRSALILFCRYPHP